VAAVIRVLLVDDDALVRAGIRLMLFSASGIEVVGEAADGTEVLGALDRHHPDVILLDLRMPRLDGLAVLDLLHTQPSPPAVVVLTTFDTDEAVLRALRRGAAGFLVKDTPPAEIIRAVRAVAAGEPMLSPTITRRLIGHVTDREGGDRKRHARQQLDRLTEREREVMRLIARGYAYKEVAKELFISIKTVETHVSSVLRKLQLSSRHELTRWANDRRLI
jgi:DNA-binding NarL/FixJ family response regulator